MRPTLDEYMMQIAEVVATRSTCSRRKVGAVITDSFGHILSTGYNGVPRKAPHCTDNACLGAEAESGTQLNICEAIHAEVNAIAQCHSIQDANTIYVTTSPCMSCMKMILATNIRFLVYKEVYDNKALVYFGANGGATIKLK